MSDRLSRLVSTVTEHNLVVVFLMLVLSAGVVYGITDLRMQSEVGGSDAIGDTPEAQKYEYIQTHYANQSDGSGASPAVVYVQDSGGNVLSKDALRDSLAYQQTVRENDSVAAALSDGDGVTGVANLVATRLAGERDATLADQIAALESASPAEVERAVTATLSEGSPALALLPNDYDPGTASAESRRMIFQFGANGESADDRRTAATTTLYETAGDQQGSDYFTLGQHALADRNQQMNQDTMELVLPVALLVILAVLAFSYRDLVDVVVGFTGVLLSVLWMFGILGWLGVPAGMTIIIGPVLIVGLSVDYGLHVFMRYREQRGEDEGIREPMTRGLAGVGVALGLVTITTAVGFLANLTNDFTVVRDLAVGITLGVVSSLVIFVTIVPALKITIDRLLERVGLDRRKQPLGESRLVKPVLASGATAAKRAAPAVVVIALLVGTVGGLAWTDLERQSFQSDEDGVAEWKQELPEPLAWEVHPYEGHSSYAAQHYRAADEDSQERSQILVEGSVTDPGTLDRLQSARDELADSAIVFERNGEVPFVSPTSVMGSVAAENDEFASVLAEADTNGDGVPDRNVEGVYDALYEAAPEQAALVVERTDGEYRSVRLVVPVAADAAFDTRTDVMRDAAATVDSSDTPALAVGVATVNAAESTQAANSILETLGIALVAVFLILTAIYRLVVGSATLGAVTVVPITLVTALVIGGMWVFDVPLTLLTALLMSLVVGLGIDYNIHVSDRFAQELDAGKPVHAAIRDAVTGTGGALLGSTLTSTGAFAALLLHPHPQITSFGTLVVLALGTSFVVSVFVLPSMLAVWARLFHDSQPRAARTPLSESSADD